MIRAPRRTREERARDPWDEVAWELARARRFERPFTLVRVDGVEPTQGMRWCGQARAVDRVWVEGTRVFVLMPEVGREAVAGLAQRFEREAPELLAGVTVRAASFPTDAVTQIALMQALETNLVLDAGKRTPDGVTNDLILRLSPATKPTP